MDCGLREAARVKEGRIPKIGRLRGGRVCGARVIRLRRAQLEIGSRPARSWGTKAGRGHLVWPLAWSAVLPGVSRRQAGFKANIGTEGVSASQIPIIPSSGPSVVLLRVDAIISSVGATETGQGGMTISKEWDQVTSAHTRRA